MRLNKYVAILGNCSRREADRWIQQGLVMINGVIETNPAVQVESDQYNITFDFDPEKRQTTTVLLHKPRGIVVTRSQNEGTNVYDILPKGLKYLSAIGRLDKESEGLILLSDDSALPRAVIDENNHCEKEYYVQVHTIISESALEKMRKGMMILGSRTKPARVGRLSKDRFSITLTEGKNKQIRRMCRKVGLKVISLVRVRISFLKIDGLESGKWRILEKKEVDALKSCGVV